MYQLAWNNVAVWKKRCGDETIPAPPADLHVTRAAVLFWEEHCVECSAPQCYSACTLFEARRDGRCRRFQYGIMPNKQVSGLFSFGADISFKRWAKLETKWPAHPAMRPIGSVRLHERWMNALEQAGSRIVPFLQQIFPSRRFNGMCTHVRRNVIRKLSSSHQLPVAQKKGRTAADLAGSVPDAFYVKCFSPESIDFRIVIELVTDAPVFRTSLQITPGWNEHLIDAAELFERADGKAGRIQVSIENDQEVRLIFSWLDLVHLKNASALLPKSQAPASDHEQPAEKIKCVAWDLDNTLWHGVIGDAGPDGVTVNEQMVHLVREFDRRGILQTIASKNNYETAWPKIESMGLADYFLYPAINWSPKSQNLKQIASELNINIDTFAFVDDSEFERHEVSSVLPQVRVFDPLQGPEFANHPEFDLPVSSESSSRRLSYLAESKRRQISQSFRGDYDRFLKSCGMSMTIRKPGRQEQPRCLELIQRSNQFNLSGRRHTEEQFEALLRSDDHDCYCFGVSDNFGAYGIVGFAAFRRSSEGPSLVEFVLSCRVAQKMVETTFFLWYARRQQQQGWNHLNAELIVTPKNAPLRSVLEALEFQCLQKDGDQQILRRTFNETIEVPDVIAILEPGRQDDSTEPKQRVA